MYENRFFNARTVLNKNGEQGISEVQRATGISYQTISRLETTLQDSKHFPQGGTAYKKVAILARHYGVSTDYLCGLIDEPNAEDRANTLRTWLGISGQASENLANMFLPQIDGNTSTDQLIAFNRLFSDKQVASEFLQLLALCMQFADSPQEKRAKTFDDILAGSERAHLRNSLIYEVKEFVGKFAETLLDEPSGQFRFSKKRRNS